MSKATLLINELDRFVEKMSGVNLPYKALQKTDDYEAFHKLFASAIKQQADAVSASIGDVLHLTHPMTALNDTQKTDVAARVKAALPPISSIIDTEDVVKFYVFAFEWGAKAQYQRWGIHKANSYSNFSLTNQKYLDKLHDRANYLLNQSSLDDTTTNTIINTIAQGKSDSLTNEEIAGQLSDDFDDISSNRANMITRTEAANAMDDGNYSTMVENDIEQFDWVAAGDNPCPICEDDEDGSPYDVGDPSAPDVPAHPNCECYRQADTSSIDLDSISIWDGGDND